MSLSPEKPQLRPLETHWIEQDGKPMLALRDRLGLTDQVALVPPALAVLLSLCDGTRDRAALRSAYELRTGVPLGPRQLESIVSQLDAALLLESPRLGEVRAAALAAYRAAPCRQPTLAGQAYPADPLACRRAFSGYGETAPVATVARPEATRGVISPHIDYERGGPVYSRVWSTAAAALGGVEVVVIFGTDHLGGPGRITLTRQSYATPFGTLGTALDVVDAVAAALGEAEAFAEELHHRGEHSIELAAVWLHHCLDGRECRVVPILCGSFQPYVDGDLEAAADVRLEAALAALRRALAGRRCLVVAAADLAHVGPAFGDGSAFGEAERAQLADADSRLLEAIRAGDAAGFLAAVRRERDRWRVCGLPPIYLALRLLGGASGQITGYAHCPADAGGGSWVSIAGAVLA